MSSAEKDNMVYNALAQPRRAKASSSNMIDISDEEFKAGTTTLYRTSPDILKRGAENKLTFRGANLDFDTEKRAFLAKSEEK